MGSDAGGEQLRHGGHVLGEHAVDQYVRLVQRAAAPVHLVVRLGQRGLELIIGELARGDLLRNMGVEARSCLHENLDAGAHNHEQNGRQHGRPRGLQQGVNQLVDLLQHQALELLLRIFDGSQRLLDRALNAGAQGTHRSGRADPGASSSSLHQRADSLDNQTSRGGLHGVIGKVRNNLADDVAIQQLQKELTKLLGLPTSVVASPPEVEVPSQLLHGRVEGDGDALVFVSRRRGLVASSLEHIHPLVAKGLVGALDPPGSAPGRIGDDLNARLTVLCHVVRVKLLCAISRTVDRTLQLARLCGAVQVIDLVVVSCVVGDEGSFLPVLNRISSLDQSAGLQGGARRFRLLQLHLTVSIRCIITRHGLTDDSLGEGLRVLNGEYLDDILDGLVDLVLRGIIDRAAERSSHFSEAMVNAEKSSTTRDTVSMCG
mmetsp:Transcript_10744/g.24024  ORF Transcript_10744/g.24024 Transcript_10744/m.24024 type:complete len:431 (-) Transcript_10744:20-1312(-)